MMYEVNKYSLAIKEKPDVRPHSRCFVAYYLNSRIGQLMKKDNKYEYFAETLEEAQAKVAELKAKKVEALKRAIQYHEDQAMYNRGRLAAIMKEHHPDAGKVIV